MGQRERVGPGAGRCRITLIVVSLLLLVLAARPPAAAAQDDDRETVLALVQAFFDSMAARDTEVARRTLLADGQFVSVRDGDDGPALRVSTHREWIDRLAGRETSLLERMWDPTVLIDGRIAVVWTRYDLYVDGEFSHCGTDVFNFLKGEAGWVMTGANWTIEQQDCEPSPLGPPGD